MTLLVVSDVYVSLKTLCSPRFFSFSHQIPCFMNTILTWQLEAKSSFHSPRGSCYVIVLSQTTDPGRVHDLRMDRDRPLVSQKVTLFYLLKFALSCFYHEFYVKTNQSSFVDLSQTNPFLRRVFVQRILAKNPPIYWQHISLPATYHVPPSGQQTSLKIVKELAELFSLELWFVDIAWSKSGLMLSFCIVVPYSQIKLLGFSFQPVRRYLDSCCFCEQETVDTA